MADEETALLGSKRQREESAANDEDEPLVRRARSEKDPLKSPSLEVPPAASWPLKHEESLEQEVGTMLDRKMPAQDKHSDHVVAEPRPSRTLAPKLADYCRPGGTLLYLPRPEWYRPWVRTTNRRRSRSERYMSRNMEEGGILANLPFPDNERRSRQVMIQVEPREALPEAPHEFLFDLPIAEPPAVPDHQQEQEQMEAPADGLLPEEAFAEFQSQPLPPLPVPAPPPQLPAAEPPVEEKKEEEMKCATFGKDCDTALHVAIRENATEAALELLGYGASAHAENLKGVTPLFLASQLGNLRVAMQLYKHDASVHTASVTGSTALIQAAHFGHIHVVMFLLSKGAGIETANNHNTTPLMRAAQEGHLDIVSLLLRRGAQVNRRNNEHMSATMLASQRGHASIVQKLVDSGAEVDATTQQESTSLMLACKRGHVAVVKVLVAAGCELAIKDSRGRTAKDMAVRKNVTELIELLNPDKQVELMQRKVRVARNYTMVRMWKLLQQERAYVPIMGENVSIHNADLVLQGGSTSALIRTMALPAPLLEHVASYMPLPRLWNERLRLATKQCAVDSNAAVAAALDLIDEILEEGGFLDACDEAQVTPPTNFSSWREWKEWGHRNEGSSNNPATTLPAFPYALTATLPGLPQFEQHPPPSIRPIVISERPQGSLLEMRRGVCFLQLLAHRTPLLGRVLRSPPYDMPAPLIQQLITVSDIQSLSRRLGSRGVEFGASLAIQMVMLAGSVHSWYSRERNFA